MKNADKTEEKPTDRIGSYNILLVDDELNSLNSLKRALKSEYNVLLASNGEDALAIMKQHDIHLVIADYLMPGMTGVELLEKVLQDHPNTVRVILTAYSDEKLLMDAINIANAHGCLTKPLTTEEIRTAVKKWNASEIERKRTEKELEETRKYAQDLIHSSLNMIIAVDKDRKIIEFNQAAQDKFGYSREEVLGKNVGMLYSNPDEGLSVYKITEKTGKLTGEIINKRKNGGTFPAFITASILHDTEGNFIGVMGISRDITEKKQVEEALRNYATELERSNQELRQFAYVASHDLREPLRMVSSYVQLLERRYKGKLDADADDFISYAVDGVTRMQNLIDDLMVYSRVNTRGKEFAPTDCNAVLEHTLADLQLTIEDSAAVVTRDTLPTVMVDDSQLGQLFQNLISNAIKFRGETPPFIHISAVQQEREWLFSVSDNGIGIDPGDNDRIFVIFQRLHSREKYPGTGIGLAICKKIVERHGGRIWIESQPGDGSTFYFTIPAIV